LQGCNGAPDDARSNDLRQCDAQQLTIGDAD
jgi:hypothetical protein